MPSTSWLRIKDGVFDVQPQLLHGLGLRANSTCWAAVVGTRDTLPPLTDLPFEENQAGHLMLTSVDPESWASCARIRVHLDARPRGATYSKAHERLNQMAALFKVISENKCSVLSARVVRSGYAQCYADIVVDVEPVRRAIQTIHQELRRGGIAGAGGEPRQVTMMQEYGRVMIPALARIELAIRDRIEQPGNIKDHGHHPWYLYSNSGTGADFITDTGAMGRSAWDWDNRLAEPFGRVRKEAMRPGTSAWSVISELPEGDLFDPHAFTKNPLARWRMGPNRFLTWRKWRQHWIPPVEVTAMSHLARASAFDVSTLPALLLKVDADAQRLKMDPDQTEAFWTTYNKLYTKPDAVERFGNGSIGIASIFEDRSHARIRLVRPSKMKTQFISVQFDYEMRAESDDVSSRGLVETTLSRLADNLSQHVNVESVEVNTSSRRGNNERGDLRLLIRLFHHYVSSDGPEFAKFCDHCLKLVRDSVELAIKEFQEMVTSAGPGIRFQPSAPEIKLLNESFDGLFAEK